MNVGASPNLLSTTSASPTTTAGTNSTTSSTPSTTSSTTTTTTTGSPLGGGLTPGTDAFANLMATMVRKFVFFLWHFMAKLLKYFINVYEETK